MLITLTGENSFRLRQALDDLVQPFLEKHGDLAYERIDGQEAEFPAIREALTSLPFLAARKLIVLRDPGANKQFAEEFETLIAEIPETTDAIIIESKPDKRSTYYKQLKRLSDLQEFKEVEAGGLAGWLVDQAKQRQASISSGDARYLIERVGANQQALSNELEKLALYNPKITRQTIDLLTEPTPQSTVFELLEAAFAGRTKRALDLYAEQRALKVEPVVIIAMLTWQLKVLAILKTAGDRSVDQIAKDAKLNPYSLRKSQGIARQLSLTRLKTLIKDLLSIDTRAKRTNLNIDEALQHYLMTLAT